MKKFISCLAVFVLLVMYGPVFALGSGDFILDSLSLKKRTDDPATEAGEGKIYYRGAVAGGIDSNTVLMLHMDGSDEGTVFTDDSDIPHTVTAYGDANTEDSESKFGGSSVEFDGTGDYLSIPDSADWNFGSGDFTLDAWVYFNSVVTFKLFRQFTSGSDVWQFEYQSVTGNLRIVADGGSGSISKSESWSPSTNTWYHVALVRNGNSWSFYIDGNEIGTADTITFSMPDNANALTIGANADSTESLNGYMDEARISKGIARWTTNFTPPTKSYVSSSNEGLYFKDENGTVVPIIEVLP